MTESRPKILVVDDERFFREAIRDALHAAEESVEVASNGEEALAAAGDPRIGVVILDMQLPDTSGIAVLRELRSRRPDLRVIVISAHADQEDVLEALRLDACDYLAKPLHEEELALAVRRAVADYEIEASRLDLRTRLHQLEIWLQDLGARADADPGGGAAHFGDRITEAVSQVTGAAKTSLMLFDPAADVLRVVATNGRNLEPREMDTVPVGEGIAGLAFARGKAVVIDDAETDGRTAGRVPRDRYESHALAVIPIGGGDRPLGVLCATDRIDGAGFSDDILGLLRMLALQSARLLLPSITQTAKSGPEDPDRDDSELARRICEALTLEIDPERLIRGVLQPVAEMLTAAPVAIHLIDNARGELVLESQVDGGRPDRECLPRDQGLTAAVLQTGRLVASNHPETDPRFDPEIDTPVDGVVGPLVCVPLTLRGKGLGVARIFPSDSRGASARTAEMLASVLSAAIRNVLLYRSVLDSIDEVAEARREAE